MTTSSCSALARLFNNKLHRTARRLFSLAQATALHFTTCQATTAQQAGALLLPVRPLSRQTMWAALQSRHATLRRGDAAHASRLQANVRARHRPCSAVAHLARRACRPCTPAHAGSPPTRRDFAGVGFALAATADDLRRFFFVAAAARPEPAPPVHCGQLLASPVAE